MNIQQALAQAITNLQAGSDSAHPDTRLDTEVLLCHVLGCNRAHLMAWPEKPLTATQQQRFEQLCRQRAGGTPVAYLTGEREFWSLMLRVNESVLIPRPETETLVAFILQHFGQRQELKLLDMGTGSGAIAIALAHEKPHWQVSACDISADALDLAAGNARRHRVDIAFIRSDWFEAIERTGYDIIVSNPPYIDPDDPHLQQGDVRFEPDIALSAPDRGMADIRQLCRQAPGYLDSKGWLILEHGYDQAQTVAACFSEYGFTDIRQQRDLLQHIRLTAGKLS